MDLQQNKLTLEKGFSILSFIVICIRAPYIFELSNISNAANWFFPVSFILERNANLFLFVYFLNLATVLFVCIKTKKLFFLLPFIWLNQLGLEGSFGKIDNILFSYIYICTLMTMNRFLPSYLQDERSLFFSGMCVGYFLAGLWKLKYLLAEENIIISLNTTLTTFIAYSIAEGSKQNFQALLFFNQYPFTSSLFWLLTIVFEIFAPILGLYEIKMQIPIAIGFLLFHILIFLFMGILFLPQMILLVFWIWFFSLNKTHYFSRSQFMF